MYQVLVPAASDAQHHVLSYSESSNSRSNAGVLRSKQQPTVEQEDFEREDAIYPANIEDTITATELHSTSEALSLLSHAAQLPSPGHPYGTGQSMSPLQSGRSVMENSNNGPLQYPLVDEGLLTGAQVSQLVAR